MSDKEISIVFPIKISNEQLELIQKFQNVIKIILKYDFKSINIADFLKMSNELEPYKKFHFMHKFNTIIDKVKNKYLNQQQQQTNFSNNYNKFKFIYKEILNNINKKQYFNVNKLALDILPVVNNILSGYEKPSKILKLEFRNPFYYENMLIFGDPNAILKDFKYEDMKNFANLDLNKPVFSYLKFPDNNKLDWFLYFIKQLKTSSESIQLSKSEFLRYQKFLYDDNEDFKLLIKYVENLMHNNDKSNIDDILNLIKQFPELYKQNESSKNDIKYVFRGIPANEEDIKNILKKDLKQKCISTSISRYAAKNFALQIGHLESEENRRSELGYIITYSVDYDSILIDTSIFGSLFNEYEILIDPKKSATYDIESI